MSINRLCVPIFFFRWFKLEMMLTIPIRQSWKTKKDHLLCMYRRQSLSLPQPLLRMPHWKPPRKERIRGQEKQSNKVKDFALNLLVLISKRSKTKQHFFVGWSFNPKCPYGPLLKRDWICLLYHNVVFWCQNEIISLKA